MTASDKPRHLSLMASALFAVSFGGTVSLFLGCSILSGVELLYYFTLRIICTLWTKHQEERESHGPPEVQQRLRGKPLRAAVLDQNKCTYIP
jgi:hypothetical protein